MKMMDFKRYADVVAGCRTVTLKGEIVKVSGVLAEARGPGIPVGSMCEISVSPARRVRAEVVGFRNNRLVLMPFEDLRGISPGAGVIETEQQPTAAVSESFLGRIVDGLGEPLDGKGKIACKEEYPIYGRPVNPLRRSIIRDVLDVGIRSINALVTLGRGQRIGIMAGSGVGKSVLMGMMAKNTSADVVIIALIGERGREVREFVEKNLDEKGLSKTTVIAVTSDSPAVVKVRGANFATTLAEYFRDRGLNVLFMMDSITRYAMALREIGLAAGEPPSAKGYTPGVFAQIPKILERAGNVEPAGSITGIYTVLVEGDDMNEPVADAVRSVTDGHIVLSRTLAQRGQYPAVDVMASISRAMKNIVENDHMDAAARFVETMAVYKDAEDLIAIGAYKDGTDKKIDDAKRRIDAMNSFLKQGIDEKADFNQSVEALKKIFD